MPNTPINKEMRYLHLAEQSVKENIKRLPCGGRLVCLEIANIANIAKIATAIFYIAH